MDFVLISLILTAIVFMTLLGLIIKIVYKRSRNKLKTTPTNKENIFVKAQRIIKRSNEILKE